MSTLKARNRIRICRMTVHYTQKDLAHLLGLPVTSISRWENGARTPNVYYAIGLSVAMQRLVDEIFSHYRREWIEKIGMNKKSLRCPQSKTKRS